jgi:hypothetical protein
MSRHAYIDHSSKLVVFWAPKTACSAVALAFAEAVVRGDGDHSRREGEAARVWLNHNGYNVSFMQAYRLVKDGGYKSIVMLREPYDRLISAFVNKFVIYKGRPIRSFEDLERSARKAVSDMQNVPARRAAQSFSGLSFFDFVTYVASGIERRGDNEPLLDNHWNTQVPFYFWERNFVYDAVFSIENSADFFAELSRLLGKEVQYARLNKSPYATGEIKKQDLTKIDSIEYCGDSSVLSKENFHSDELKRIVSDLYKPDLHYLSLARKPDMVAVAPSDAIEASRMTA